MTYNKLALMAVYPPPWAGAAGATDGRAAGAHAISAVIPAASNSDTSDALPKIPSGGVSAVCGMVARGPQR